MTSINHSCLAGAAAIATIDQSISVKIAVAVALVISHVPLDAIPHLHFYDFSCLRLTWKGALFELGIAFIAIPLTVWLISDASFFWVGTCILSSSLVDFLIAAKIKWVKKLNHAMHSWEDEYAFSPICCMWEENLFTLFCFSSLFSL